MCVQAFSDYLTLERHYSPHTVQAYLKDLSDFKTFLNSKYPDILLEKVSYSAIRSWVVFLVDSGLNNRSVNRKISSLKTFYRFLLKTKQIAVSPLAQHRMLKTQQEVQIPFSIKEIEEVMNLLREQDDFESVRDLLMIELFYSTGIRRAELINIRLHDFSESGMSLKVLGKRNKERIIPVLPTVLKGFKTYLIHRNSLSEIRDSDYLLLTSKGRKLYPALVYRVINTYFGQVSEKLKKSPHILRHSFATHLLNEGANINAVKELLGHSSLASTQVYTQNSIETLKEVYRKSHPRS